MKVPSPADVLRHRGPALLIGAVESAAGETLACTSRGEGPWRWPDVLEGAAQCAGFLTGLRPGGLTNRAVVAEYRDVRVHAGTHAGTIHFVARVERRLLHFWRCRVEARAGDGAMLLEGSVTLAPAREG